MFKSSQITYPVQSPKVAAMKQFIQMQQRQPQPPAMMLSVQPYGNDLSPLNSLVGQLNQVSTNLINLTENDFFGNHSRRGSVCSPSIPAPTALLPRRHYTDTSLPLQNAHASPATPWEIQKTCLQAMLEKISADGSKFVPEPVPGQKDTKSDLYNNNVQYADESTTNEQRVTIKIPTSPDHPDESLLPSLTSEPSPMHSPQQSIKIDALYKPILRRFRSVLRKQFEINHNVKRF